MDQKKITCKICFSDYNSTNAIPYILPCGHTICSRCFYQIKTECPFCKKPFTKSSPQTNFQLLSEAEEQNQEEEKKIQTKTSKKNKIKVFIAPKAPKEQQLQLVFSVPQYEPFSRLQLDTKVNESYQQFKIIQNANNSFFLQVCHTNQYLMYHKNNDAITQNYCKANEQNQKNFLFEFLLNSNDKDSKDFYIKSLGANKFLTMNNNNQIELKDLTSSSNQCFIIALKDKLELFTIIKFKELFQIVQEGNMQNQQKQDLEPKYFQSLIDEKSVIACNTNSIIPSTLILSSDELEYRKSHLLYIECPSQQSKNFYIKSYQNGYY